NKLSPWFSDRRNSTIAEINEQLAYREENKKAVAEFSTTRTIGINTKILFDENAQKFLVTSARDWREANPDVLDFSQVTGCNLDIDEDSREEKTKDKEGKSVSYNPPRYNYYYDFYMTLHVNHPYFDEIKFKINGSSLETTTSGAVTAMRKPNPRINQDYKEYEAMGREIEKIFNASRNQIRKEAAEASAPKQAVTCPYCGATTTPDASGCCEFCGGAVNG
ncbi:MAG: hypothetical protein IKU20_08290, partial [Lachnospiraceae bacterium]|nr:hypothetical protein [Lachnospiraceae bacterium]